MASLIFASRRDDACEIKPVLLREFGKLRHVSRHGRRASIRVYDKLSHNLGWIANGNDTRVTLENRHSTSGMTAVVWHTRKHPRVHGYLRTAMFVNLSM
jgi:hypothetical protein